MKGGFKACEIGKCQHVSRKIIQFRDHVFNWWDNRDWKLPSTKKSQTKQVPHDFQYGERRPQMLPHQPVILNLLQHGYKLTDALGFYCGEESRFGLPEYQNIIRQVDAFISGYQGSKTSSDYIPKIIMNVSNMIFSRGGNVLQPRLWQIFIFHMFINDPRYRIMNNLQSPHTSLQEKWKTYVDLFGHEHTIRSLFNFDVLGSSHDEDLDKRAQIVAFRCVKNEQITELYTIDGHGRFIVRLIREIFKLNDRFFSIRSNFRIHVCDIDYETHLWHMMTLPLHSSYCGNVLDLLDNAIEDKSIKSKMFYLNFSGLFGQGNRIARAFTHIPLEFAAHLIVSFSSARDGLKYATKLYNDLMNLNAGIQPLTPRSIVNGKLGDFVTMGVYIPLNSLPTSFKSQSLNRRKSSSSSKLYFSTKKRPRRSSSTLRRSSRSSKRLKPNSRSQSKTKRSEF